MGDSERVPLRTLDGRREFRVRWSQYGRPAVARGDLRGEVDLVYGDGVFYLALVVGSKDAPRYQPTGVLGVDLGVVNLAVDSDGNTFTADGVDRVRTRTDHLRRVLPSSGTKSAQRHLQKIGRREANFRRPTNHSISKRIVARSEEMKRAAALEDLGGIRRRTTVRRSQRRRHISWSFAQLRAFVEYRAPAKGVPVVLLDPRNTSRTCPSCGTVEERKRRTRDEFRGVSCGLAGPANRIAATNIAAKAGVDRPIVAGSDETWGHVFGPSGAVPKCLA